jgi:hypothetical protein
MDSHVTMRTKELERLEAEQGWNPGTTPHEIQDVAVAADKCIKEIFPELDLRGCRCSLCHRLEDEYNKCAQRMECIAEEIREHVVHRTQERSTEYSHRKKSRDRPDKYVSITIDAADQAYFHLPHWAESDKDEASAFKVKTDVVGALMHHHAPNIRN